MDVLQSGTMALLVLAALVGTLFFLQRRGWAQLGGPASGKTRRLEAVERLALTPHHSMHLIRVNGRLVLVSNGPGGSAMMYVEEQS